MNTFLRQRLPCVLFGMFGIDKASLLDLVCLANQVLCEVNQLHAQL